MRVFSRVIRKLSPVLLGHAIRKIPGAHLCYAVVLFYDAAMLYFVVAICFQGHLSEKQIHKAQGTTVWQQTGRVRFCQTRRSSGRPPSEPNRRIFLAQNTTSTPTFAGSYFPSGTHIRRSWGLFRIRHDLSPYLCGTLAVAQNTCIL